MNIAIQQKFLRAPSRQDLPELPQPKDSSKGATFKITHVGPDKVKTRLGSIPEDYTSLLSGFESSDRYQPGEAKEAENRYGDRDNIYRYQPQFNSDTSVKMREITEEIEAKPYSKTGKSITHGLLGAVIGGIAGGVVGMFLGNPIAGAVIGATAVGGVFGRAGYQIARDDRVKLEWQETSIKEYELVGYRYDRDENEDDEGNTEDYDHEFDPIIASKTVGTYFKPVVVHFDKDDAKVS